MGNKGTKTTDAAVRATHAENEPLIHAPQVEPEPIPNPANYRTVVEVMMIDTHLRKIEWQEGQEIFFLEHPKKGIWVTGSVNEITDDSVWISYLQTTGYHEWLQLTRDNLSSYRHRLQEGGIANAHNFDNVTDRKHTYLKSGEQVQRDDGYDDGTQDRQEIEAKLAELEKIARIQYSNKLAQKRVQEDMPLEGKERSDTSELTKLNKKLRKLYQKRQDAFDARQEFEYALSIPDRLQDTEAIAARMQYGLLDIEVGKLDRKIQALEKRKNSGEQSGTSRPTDIRRLLSSGNHASNCNLPVLAVFTALSLISLGFVIYKFVTRRLKAARAETIPMHE